MEINAIWHSGRHSPNSRGFVCVAETPAGVELLGFFSQQLGEEEKRRLVD